MSSCWVDGYFNFTPLYREVEAIRLEVADMSDSYLVDEVAYLCEDNDEIDDILYSFITTTRLTEKDRQKLIWFYILVMIEDYLRIDEDGEW